MPAAAISELYPALHLWLNNCSDTQPLSTAVAIEPHQVELLGPDPALLETTAKLVRHAHVSVPAPDEKLS